MTRDAEPFFGFDSQFLRKLEQVALTSRRPIPGPFSGPRRSPRYGSSPEFADFRDYTPGDDLRRVDWNAYARLDRLFLRLYTAEEMATLTLLLDTSRSMDFGDPRKSLTTARLAAIFSYIALHGNDRVAVAGWSSRVHQYLPPQVGTQAVSRVWRFIHQLQSTSSGSTDFAVLRSEGPFRRRAGLAVVLSDFLSDTDWRGGLLALRSAGQEVTALQILSRDELEPGLRGDWQLRDVESGATVEITSSQRLLRRYAEQLQAHLESIRDFCRRHDMVHIVIPSDDSLEHNVLRHLQRAGVLT